MIAPAQCDTLNIGNQLRKEILILLKWEMKTVTNG